MTITDQYNITKGNSDQLKARIPHLSLSRGESKQARDPEKIEPEKRISSRARNTGELLREKIKKSAQKSNDTVSSRIYDLCIFLTRTVHWLVKAEMLYQPRRSALDVRV